MSKDILGVLKALCHLLIIAIKSLTQWHDRSLSSLVNICDQSIFGVQQDLSVVLEINLDDLVAESEHYCMLGTHPLLDVNRSWRGSLNKVTFLFSGYQILLSQFV